MTFYCFTHECLREYILRYFGEYGSNYCGNCSNCLTQFEEVDVTDLAKALIGCVKESRWHYGMMMIVDTVHGSKAAKVLKAGMDRNPWYGSCENAPVYQLRQVMNHLVLEGYLHLADGEYRTVELTERSEEVLNGSSMVMKAAKKPQKAETESKTKKKTAVFGEEDIDRDLFEKLRALRLRIAKEEKVPPYIVFSDKTLAHMCQLRPQNREAMLEVSGVGEMKYEKYGEQFLECIQDWKG